MKPNPFKILLEDFRKFDDTLDKKRAGVYAFTKDSEVVYVGHSVDIARRVKQHLKSKKGPILKDCRIDVYTKECEAKDFRLALECCMILRTRPVLNRAIILGLTTRGTLYEPALTISRKAK